MSAGLDLEMGDPTKFPNPMLKQAFQTDIPRAELFALGMQAANLAYKGGKFDWNALLIAALQAPVNKVIGEVGSQMPTQGPISSALANSGFYGPVPSVFANDFISQEVSTHHFDAELAAADAVGSDAGNMTAFALYDVYKRQTDQQAQMGWRKQSQTNKSTNQTNSLDQLNATANALGKETQKINAELAALGNINPFTGEPLDSGVANDPNGINAVGATLRGRPQGAPDDPNANNINKNPSYTNRQVQHDASVNRAQRWSEEQQKRNNQNANQSSSQGGFFSNLGKGLFEGAKDAFTLNFSDKNNMHGRWEQWGYATGLLGGIAGGIVSGQDEKLVAVKGIEEAIEVTKEISKIEWQTPEEAMKSMNELQIQNLKRFLSKIPQNSNSVKVRDFLNGGKVFQADSPAQNIPGSFAQYEKQIDATGNTVLYNKTTFAPNGEIISIAPKLPYSPKMFPEYNFIPENEFTP